MRRLPPLSALATFECVARAGGITAAAAELGMTPGAVSKQILKLEQWFGGALFQRAGRGLLLIEAGRRLLQEIGPALDQIEAASRKVDRRSPNALRISAPPTFMAYWLVPRLGLFQQRHPHIDIQLDNKRDRSRALPEHADVAVRRGLADATGFSAHPFMPEALLPVFGAGLPGRDDIRAPADLAKTTWLTATMRPDDWQRWLAKARLTSLSPERWVTFDHTNLALGAAMDGLGVAIAPAYLIEGELRAGRLIAPFAELIAPDDSHYVLCRTGQENRPPVRAFREWLHEQGTAHADAVSAYFKCILGTNDADSQRVK
jgi:LysR family glycine cleavage system transcriptional activator